MKDQKEQKSKDSVEFKQEQMNSSIEIWHDIKNYESLYMVSNFGRIKRLQKQILKKGTIYNLPEKILKPKVQSNGYLSIGLTIDGVRKTYNIHRLVADAFLENTENKQTINHIDGIKKNNYYLNLEWCTHSENSVHAKNIGLKYDVFGEDHGNTKLTNSDVINIRDMAANNKTSIEISKLYPSVSYATIRNIITRKTWDHI